MQISDNGLGSVFVGVVCVEESGVLHELCHVSCLATGGAGHVQDPLVLLGRQRHHGKQGRRTLENVVA